MPGLDKDRLIDSSHIDDEMLCGICLEIFIDPMVTPCCRQTYCRDCIREWLQTHDTCPNDRKLLKLVDLVVPPRFLINLLNRLEFKCEFVLNGCNERITPETQATHIESCKCNPNANCDVCGEKIGFKTDHNCLANVLSNRDNIIKSNLELNKAFNEYVYETDKTIVELKEEINSLRDEKLLLEQKNHTFSKCIAEFSKHFSHIKNEINLIDRSLVENAKQFVCIETQNLDSVSCIHSSLIHETTIHYRFKNISKLGLETKNNNSVPILFNGFLWHLNIGLDTDNKKDLKCFVYCKPEYESSSWSCMASATINVVSHKPDVKNHSQKFSSPHKFNETSDNWGFRRFISWSDLIDENNGYVKDDSILIEVFFSFVN